MRDATLTSPSRFDPAAAWEPWVPGPDDPWNLRWAGHLYRRAGFGASWPELQAALQVGPEAAIDRLLTGGVGQSAFDRLMDALGPGGQDPSFGFFGGQPGDEGLASWWLARIRRSPHPLRERMTLFWHDHFATSIVKVQQPAAMKAQNLLLREHALGSFRPLLLEMSRDPAMLIWLDSDSNVRGKPNENYARELMELFSLGVGQYTETEVQEAARAFTGWQTSRNPDGLSFTFNRSQHDDGSKTILGQTGPWDGADVVRIVLDQPAAARFLAGKLYRQFVSEAEPPPDDLIDPLADRFRSTDYDIADLVETILRSRLFFSEHAYRQRIKGPVEYVIGLLKALEAEAPEGGSAPPLSGLLDGLGQSLFTPPNVKGWPGGESWLNTATVLARQNLAWRIVQGVGGPAGLRVDPRRLLREHAGTVKGPEAIDFLLDLLLQPAEGEIDRRARDALTRYLDETPTGEVALDRRLRETIHAIVLMPEYQLN
ncbi:hypothetical protein BH23PLA1_BH23PLA1_03080 [soil metagenome]